MSGRSEQKYISGNLIVHKPHKFNININKHTVE